MPFSPVVNAFVRKPGLLGVLAFISLLLFFHSTSWTPGRVQDFAASLDDSSADDADNTDPTETGAEVEALTSVNVTAVATYDDIQERIQELREGWEPPNAVSYHWPPYAYYADKDYDPNRWEGFDWEHDFYLNNGIKRLPKPQPYLPYPEYNSVTWKQAWMGEYKPCEGPRGRLLNETDDDIVHAYSRVPHGFPKAAIGDAKPIGIDDHRCFDRYGRYGPYGHGQDVRHRVAKWKRPTVKPDWSQVRWDRLQDQCLVANRHRYRPRARWPVGHPPDKDMPLDSSQPPLELSNPLHGQRYHHRTALLVRTWTGYKYTANDMEAIRALITELSLLSGGEYQVFLLVNVKDFNSEMWTSSQVYQDTLDAHVPQEFHGISILWNEKMLQEWYPEIGDWQVYWHQFMPLQWFSKLYPEFDFIWNWETDTRYTGNHYHFFEQVAEFAKKMPRKYLWERNSRFYIPQAHGTYEQFLNDTDAIVQKAVGEGKMDVVWGAQPYNATAQEPIGPTPPRQLEQDDFEWGVGEEADLVTLQPIWDPKNTWWTYKDKIFNFIPGVRPHFSEQDPLDKDFNHPEFEKIPRRTYINTVSRFSRRQLHAMHLENAAGRTMQAEMWPATVALHHGLKAVYAPHPIWADHRWPAWYMDAVFNADGNETARWGSRYDSVYNQDREHNFEGWTWYFNSKFSRILHRRWLGWSATIGTEEEVPNNALRTLGGKQFEEEGFALDTPLDVPEGDGTFGGREVAVGGRGRMCLPPMLLHPVKRVFEGAEGNSEDDGGYEGGEGSPGWLKGLKKILQ